MNQVGGRVAPNMCTDLKALLRSITGGRTTSTQNLKGQKLQIEQTYKIGSE